MKIVCIYGDDSVTARDRYFKIIDTIKKRGWEHVVVTSNQKISEQLVSTSLFEGDKLYSVIDAQKISTKEYEWIHAQSDEHQGSLLLLFGATIPQAIKKNLPKNTSFEEFKIKQEIFAFLDVISPQKSKILILKLHQILDTNPPEFVLAMIARQMRDIAWVKKGTGMSLPPWRKQKLERQAKLFTDEQLVSLISKLADADVQSKSGGGELSLLLDLALISL